MTHETFEMSMFYLYNIKDLMVYRKYCKGNTRKLLIDNAYCILTNWIKSLIISNKYFIPEGDALSQELFQSSEPHHH